MVHSFKSFKHVHGWEFLACRQISGFKYLGKQHKMALRCILSVLSHLLGQGSNINLVPPMHVQCGFEQLPVETGWWDLVSLVQRLCQSKLLKFNICANLLMPISSHAYRMQIVAHIKDLRFALIDVVLRWPYVVDGTSESKYKLTLPGGLWHGKHDMT